MFFIIYNTMKYKKNLNKMNKIWYFIKDEDGLETSEYAVMGFLIIVILVGAVTALRTQIAAVFGQMTASLGG